MGYLILKKDMKKCILKRTLFMAFIPVVLSSILSCNKNKDEKLSSVSEEQISPFEGELYGGSGEPPVHFSISNLYDAYKHSEQPSSFYYFNKKYDEITFESNNKYICYYLNEDIYNEIVQIPPVTGISLYNADTLFTFLSTYKRLEDRQKYLKTYETNRSDNFLYNIDNYRLITITKFFKTEKYQDKDFIDFLSFSRGKNEYVTIKENRPDELRYFTKYDFERDFLHQGCTFIPVLDFLSFRIEKYNYIDVINEDFQPNNDDLEFDDNYYDDLEQCMVTKELVKTTSSGQNIYNVNYSLSMIRELFNI